MTWYQHFGEASFWGNFKAVLFCTACTVRFVGNKYRVGVLKEIICTNLCNNTAEVKEQI